LASIEGHGVVAGRHQTRAAAEGRAFDQGHGQGRDVVQGLEHVSQFQGVGAVVVLVPRRRSAIQARSAPALNAPPTPRRNTIRTPSAPCRVSKACARPEMVSASKAFFLVGPSVDPDGHRALGRAFDVDQRGHRLGVGQLRRWDRRSGWSCAGPL
jgi:hypothetical protein